MEPTPLRDPKQMPQNHQIAARIIGLVLTEVETLLAIPYDADEAPYVNHRLELLLQWISYERVATIAAAPSRNQRD